MEHTEQKLAWLARHWLFVDLAESDLDDLVRLLSTFSAARGERLFAEGAPIDRVFALVEGTVEIAARAPGGELVVLGAAGPGDLLGEAALNERSLRSAEATALGPVRGFVIDVDAFEAMARGFHPSALKVLRRLSLHLCGCLRDSTSALAASTALAGPEVFEASVEPAPEMLGFFRVLPLLREFTDAELAELLTHMCQWSVPRGRRLFAQGAAASSCYIAARGALEVEVVREGQHHRLGVLGPGRLIGEAALVDRRPRTATCTVREDAILLELPGAAFDALYRDGSRIAFKLIKAINHGQIVAQRGTDARRVAMQLPGPPPAQVSEAPREPAEAAVRAFDRAALIARIRDSVIGDGVVLEGPFGPTRLVYADFTASGRSLTFLEDLIQREVLPLYANTHTESSGTGWQTSRLREDARRIIRRAVRGGADDLVIFTGSGATGAIDKLTRVLGLTLPEGLDQRLGLRAQIPADERPVVFIGPYEHHSNELPWRYSIADVVTIDADESGRIDLADLARRLVEFAVRPLKIGSFSAASNVTGIISDDLAITALLHRHGALSFWDYAAAGPYVQIDMNPEVAGVDPALTRKDAVFISPHKFIGGPGTPGVLVGKRALFAGSRPTVPGGGTVGWVSSEAARFLDDLEHREEAGTPAIVESIRAGLVFQLKEAVGTAEIHAREDAFARRAIASWSRNENLWVLGNPALPRLPIISLAVRRGDRLMHWNFMVAILNDLFGIQARGGCSCAGPYALRLFAIDDTRARAFEAVVAQGYHGIKPGWFRVSFNYFITDIVADYIIEAVHIAADEGHKLMPWYRFDPMSALWTHVDREARPLLSLDDLHYSAGTLEFTALRTTEGEEALPGYLARARALLARVRPGEQPSSSGPSSGPASWSPEFEALRWFTLPGEAAAQVQ